MGPVVAEYKVVTACDNHWEKYKSDCSGFVKAVAGELGVALQGDANAIADAIKNTPWKLLKDGVEAKQKAELGYFVLGALKASPNGHVVVVVPGELNRSKYPTAYWGSLGRVGKKKTTINWSWTVTDLEKVYYAYYTSKNFGRVNIPMRVGR
jgi:hypothetical protein